MTSAHFSMEWKRDTPDVRTLPRTADPLTYVCRELTYAAIGTYVDAEFEAEGAMIDIVRLVQRLGRGVNVRDERAMVVWAGRLHAIAIQDAAFEHSLSMDEFGNALAVVYYQVSSGSADFGKRTRSDWSADSVSIGRYGTHQQILTRTRMTAAEATSELTRVLTTAAAPEYTVTRKADTSQTMRWRARLTLKGEWYYQQRIYYTDLSNVVRLTDETGASHEQAFGEGSGIQDVFFPFAATNNYPPGGAPPSEVNYRPFDANTVVLKMRKVVDGWGDNAQPTDSVVVDIMADAPKGVYLGDVVAYNGADRWTLTGPVAVKDNNGNPYQAGWPMNDMNWRGVWLGAAVDIMIGRPFYGQTDLVGYPVNWEKRVDGNSFGVAVIPRLDVKQWLTGWDSSGSTVGNPPTSSTYRVGSRFQLLAANQSTQQVTGQPFAVAGPDFGTNGDTPNIIATSVPVPASKISTTTSEVSFTFSTPFRVDGTRLWIRVRRTEPYTNADEKYWRGKGYYLVAGHKQTMPQSYSLLTRVFRSDLKHWKCAIPINYRDTTSGQNEAPLPVWMWHKVTGTRDTVEQLQQIALDAYDRVERCIVDTPRYTGAPAENGGTPNWTSGTATVPYQSGDRTAQDVIERILTRGDAQGRRMTIKVLPRTAQNYPAFSIMAVAFEPWKNRPVILGRDGRLTRDGMELQQLPPPVGQWIQPEAGLSLDAGLRPPMFFCEEASWSPENGLELLPQRGPRFGQLPDDTEAM